MIRRWVPEILLVVGLVAAAAGWWRLRHPVDRTEPAAELAAPRPEPGGVASDVVLVADPLAVAGRQAGPPAQRDRTFAWVSILEQEFGPWRLLRPADLTLANVGEARVLVVPANTWKDLSGVAVGVVADFAQQGVVVAESPGEHAARLTHPSVIVLDPPLADRVFRIQQGVRDPANDPAPGALYGVPDGYLQPRVLADPEVPQRAFEPIADVLERAVLSRVEAIAPLARWWPIPDGLPGFVAVSHDEEGFGDKASWIAKEGAVHGFESTTFVMLRRMTRAGLDDLALAGSKVHVHWDRGFMDQRTEIRFGPLGAYRRDLSLAEQRERLAALGAAPPARILNRNHGLVWDPEPGRTFRMLHAAGVEADSTYGPSGKQRFGYVFGTGLPFRPLDDSGWPFPLLEVPFLFQDDESLTPDDQRRLIRESAAQHHELVGAIYPVNPMAHSPSVDAIESWLDLPEVARETGVGVGSFDAFLDVWFRRLRSPLTTTWDAKARVLTARGEAAGKRLALRVPVRAGEATVHTVRLDGSAVSPGAVLEVSGARVIRVPEGSHELTVDYR